MNFFLTLTRLPKKIAVLALLVLALFMVSASPVSWAAGDDIGTNKTTIPTLLPVDNTNVGGDSRYCTGLADMIRTGNIHLWNIPCFVKFFTETLIAFAGTLSVFFVIFGGFRYVAAGVSDDKDAAKKTITYALIGLAVTLLAWVIVDLALQVATD